MVFAMTAGDLLEKLGHGLVSVDEQLEALNMFKAHVKRELVDLNLVSRYFKALVLAVKSTDHSVSLLAFNVLGHLVKRLSMQNPDGSVLHSSSSLIIPILLLRLSDSRSLTRAQAKRALEAYYFAAADDVERCLVEISFKSDNVKLISDSVHWLEYIMREVNQQYNLTRLKPALFDLVSHLPDPTVFEAVLDLLFSFYNLARNKHAQHTLAHEMESCGVSVPTILKIMLRVTGSAEMQSSTASNQKRFSHLQTPYQTLINNSDSPFISSGLDHQQYPSNIHALQSTSTLAPVLANASIQDHDMSTAHESFLASANLLGTANSSLIASDSPFIDASDHSIADSANGTLSPKLEKLLAKVNYELDVLIGSEDIQDSSTLETLAQDSITVFLGKETEFNWAERERTILHWRKLLRGNSFLRSPDILLACLRDLTEGICKAITSLRTTLSTHGCQLVKECAIILRASFDPVADAIMPALVKLCSATKSIASNNANMAMCAIYCNSSYNHKLLQRVYAASNDKNSLPRQFSTLWLQILLIRFSTNQNFSTPHGASNITGSEVTSKILTKLLTDANAAVRQVAKECYWCYAEIFPNDANQLLSTLDIKTSRILEKSKPGNSQSSTESRNVSSRKPYVSIKQLVIEKNRELRAKQREQGPVSFSRSRFNSDSLTRTNDRPSRLGAPKRVVTMPLKAEITNANVLRNPSAESFLHSDPVVSTKSSNSWSPDEHPATNTPFFKSASEQPMATNTSPPIDIPQLSIVALLSSNETRLVQEGIEMLKLAILENKDISPDTMAPLYLVSVREPNLLSPLLLATDTLFRKSAQLFTHIDFFRVSCILLSPIEHNSVDQIILVMQVDHIHEAIIQNLSYAISTRNILDDDNLSMQFIKYLSTIIKLIIDFLVVALERIPISDGYLSKLSSLMFELVPMLQTTDAFELLAQVLKKLHCINPPRFVSQMIMLDARTKAEVDAAAEIDHTLDLRPVGFTRLDPSNELGQFARPSDDLDNISPVKVSSFTGTLIGGDAASEMSHEWSEQNSPAKNSIFSGNTAGPQNGKAVHDTIIEDDRSDAAQSLRDRLPIPEGELLDSLDETMRTAGINIHAAAASESILDQSVLDTRDELMGDSLLHSDGNTSMSHAHETNLPAFEPIIEESVPQPPEMKASTSNDFIDDFASVNIKESARIVVPRQQFTDLATKMDPLNAISNKSHAISIFEDRDNSPQKVKAYSYSDLNWFNFHLTKMTNESMAEIARDAEPIAAFQLFCGLLANQSASGDTFMALLNHLQLPALYGAEFNEHLANEGYRLLEGSLKSYFGDLSPLRHAGIVGGLILIKQMLISKYQLPLDWVWSLLLCLAEDFCAEFEMMRALTEVFQETLTGVYTSKDLFESVLANLENLDSKQHLLTHQSLVLESVSTLLAMNSVQKLVKATVAELIAVKVHDYLSHPSVEVRRLAVINYAQLVKISRHRESHSDFDQLASTINTLLTRLTLPQQKLVEHYSKV